MVQVEAPPLAALQLRLGTCIESSARVGRVAGLAQKLDRGVLDYF
jgi:hypothetical protein